MLFSILSFCLLSKTVVFGFPIALDDSHPTQKTFHPISDTTIDRSADYPLYPHYSGVLLFSERHETTNPMSTTFDTRHPTVILENSARINYHCDAGKSHLVVDTFDTEGVSLVSSWPNGLVIITNEESCNLDGERGIYQITRCENCAGGKEMGVRPLDFHVSQREWKDMVTSMRVAYSDAVFETMIRSSPKGSVVLEWLQQFWKDQLQLE